MKTTLIHRYTMLMATLMAALMLASCGNDTPEADDVPAIAFASFALDQEESVTRAATPLARDFTVYGYKTVNSQSQKVFDSYAVKYKAGSANTSEDNTHGYYYAMGGQSIKYWDFSASEYRFWGYTGDKNDFTTPEGTELTIPVSGLLSASEPTLVPLYSKLYIREPISSDVVRLEFMRPYAKIRVLFYTNDSMEGSDEIQLTGIKFTPDGGKKIYKAGTVTVTYSLSKTTETVETTPSTNSADEQTKLTYRDVTLTPSAGYASDHAALAQTVYGTDFYYTLPMEGQNPSFTMTAIVNDEPKTAVVPANFMQWKPNFFYTYIFKITEAGKKIELYDVQIAPWHYGGSQNDEWKNW